ncbi:MAG: nucleotidyltransferase family protein [Ilumatobacteraceae bacterium]
MSAEPMRLPPPSNHALWATQRAILTFGHLMPAQLQRLSDDEWSRLSRWAGAERVLGLACHALLDQPELTSAQRAELEQLGHCASMISLHVDASARRAGRRLSDAGVDFRVLKGYGTARILYPDPSWRQYGDFDVLVRRDDFERAVKALSPSLVGSPPAQPGPARRSIVKEYPLLDDRGIEIDMHVAVQGSLFTSTLDTAVLFSGGQPIPGAEHMFALSPTGLFVHAVLHVSTVNWRTSSIPDVLRLAEDVDPLDEEFRSLIRTRQQQALFAWALGRVLLWAPLPDAWQGFRDRYHPVGRQASLYEWVHVSEERARLANTLLGPRRLKRLAETVWPSQEFLEEWGIDHFGNLRRLFSDAVTAAGRR